MRVFQVAEDRMLRLATQYAGYYQISHLLADDYLIFLAWSTLFINAILQTELLTRWGVTYHRPVVDSAMAGKGIFLALVHPLAAPVAILKQLRYAAVAFMLLACLHSVTANNFTYRGPSNHFYSRTN